MMENLKVKVNNEAEIKEVQELFFELGCYIDYPKKCLDDAVILFSESCGLLTYSSTETYTNDGTPYKEITIPQLRDLVVLKRNDKNDATHSTDGESGLAVMLGGVWYGYNFNEKKWESWVDDEDYKLKDLKPIEKEKTETEYLMQGKNGERLMESVGQLKGTDATLSERQSTYGSFVGVANTTGQLMGVIKNSANGQTLPYAHEEALHMICSKIARIVNGDCNHKDSWHDIGGYAKLIENLIEGK